jgi:hypothetical protein
MLVQRPTPNLEDLVSVFMTPPPGDRVAQLCPQALGIQFSRILRHACVTVGLFFNPGHHRGHIYIYIYIYMEQLKTLHRPNSRAEVTSQFEKKTSLG